MTPSSYRLQVAEIPDVPINPDARDPRRPDEMLVAGVGLEPTRGVSLGGF